VTPVWTLAKIVHVYDDQVYMLPRFQTHLFNQKHSFTRFFTVTARRYGNGWACWIFLNPKSEVD
jgi:hypothetical protein